jgi:hypothetical protein
MVSVKDLGSSALCVGESGYAGDGATVDPEEAVGQLSRLIHAVRHVRA